MVAQGSTGWLVPIDQAIKRSGAQSGDLICVSGALGDAGAALNFLHLESSAGSTNPNISYFLERYFGPQPKIALGCFLRDYATAAIDISDGLLADFGHIAQLSNVGGILYENKIPRSEALKLENDFIREMQKVYTEAGNLENEEQAQSLIKNQSNIKIQKFNSLASNKNSQTLL
mgnify:CR=1 FL=1